MNSLKISQPTNNASKRNSSSFLNSHSFLNTTSTTATKTIENSDLMKKISNLSLSTINNTSTSIISSNPYSKKNNSFKQWNKKIHFRKIKSSLHLLKKANSHSYLNSSKKRVNSGPGNYYYSDQHHLSFSLDKRLSESQNQDRNLNLNQAMLTNSYSFNNNIGHPFGHSYSFSYSYGNDGNYFMNQPKTEKNHENDDNKANHENDHLYNYNDTKKEKVTENSKLMKMVMSALTRKIKKNESGDDDDDDMNVTYPMEDMDEMDVATVINTNTAIQSVITEENEEDLKYEIGEDNSKNINEGNN